MMQLSFHNFLLQWLVTRSHEQHVSGTHTSPAPPQSYSQNTGLLIRLLIFNGID